MEEGVLADISGIPMPNLFQAPEELVHVINVLNAGGYGSWIVGGAVRDVILGLNPKEYDICTTATPEEIVESFEDTIPTGIRYGTITVRCGDSMFEVTTLRTEKGYGDGRRPDEVEWGHSLEVDLSRRDFTMNAMAYDLARGLLHDPFEGRNDLKQGKLRAVGIAGQRLSEDGLRIMRAYRFMDRGEIGVWLPDSELSDALIDNRAMLAMVSIERIWNELERVILGFNCSMILERMNRDGILPTILHTAIPNNSFEILSMIPADLEARLAIILRFNSTQEVGKILSDLKAPSKVVKRAKHLHFLLGHTPSESEKRIYRAVISDEVPTHKILREALGENTKHIEDSLQYPPSVNCLVDGEWIMQRTNLKPGVRLGRLKEWIHRIQIEQNISTLEDMERALCTIPWQHGEEDEWPRVLWPCPPTH